MRLERSLILILSARVAPAAEADCVVVEPRDVYDAALDDRFDSRWEADPIAHGLRPGPA